MLCFEAATLMNTRVSLCPQSYRPRAPAQFVAFVFIFIRRGPSACHWQRPARACSFFLYIGIHKSERRYRRAALEESAAALCFSASRGAKRARPLLHRPSSLIIFIFDSALSCGCVFLTWTDEDRRRSAGDINFSSDLTMRNLPSPLFRRNINFDRAARAPSRTRAGARV